MRGFWFATVKLTELLLILLVVSFAINVTLYTPLTFGTVKLVLYLVPVAVSVYVWKLPLGMVTFARTMLTATLSVTFTPISMICDTLRFVLFTGVRLINNGEVMSVSCVVITPLSIVTLYNCGEKSPSSVMKLNLYWKRPT